MDLFKKENRLPIYLQSAEYVSEEEKMAQHLSSSLLIIP